jgi:multimeric flavodoxin WrbA
VDEAYGAGLRALGLNCTLKRSPEESNTAALMRRVTGLLADHGVETEIVRPVAYAIKFGITSDEGNEQGQYPLYNKVAGVVVTGNEDGAHACAESTLSTSPTSVARCRRNVDMYWVGDAGPGPSYIEAGGEEHPYTLRTSSWCAHNLLHMARILKHNPIPPEGNTLEEHGGDAVHTG